LDEKLSLAVLESHPAATYQDIIPSYVVVRTSIRRFFIANDEL
jgi:hypothetical protein